MELFGEVRSLLHDRAPSAQAWEALCTLIDRSADDPRERELIDYAKSMLRGWPDALRMVPLRWLAQERWAAMRLARVLDLTDDALDMTRAVDARPRRHPRDPPAHPPGA